MRVTHSKVIIYNMFISWKQKQPYLKCRPYVKHFLKKNQKNSELAKFKREPIYRNLTQDVFQRLGIPEMYNTEKHIWSMWIECTFKQARDLNESSPWCAVSIDRHLYVEY